MAGHGAVRHEAGLDFEQHRARRKPLRHARHSVCQVGGYLPGPEQVAEEVSQMRRHGLVARRPQDDTRLQEAGDVAGRYFSGIISGFGKAEVEELLGKSANCR